LIVVLDASAALELLLRTARAPAVEARLFAPGVTAHAPHLIDVEILQVLRRCVRGRTIAEARATEALDDWRALRVRRHAHAPFLDAAWAMREGLTAYDAVYVALAEALDAPLVTADARIARAPGHGARVEVVT